MIIDLNLLILFTLFFAPFIVTYLLTRALIPKLIKAGMTGKDENKSDFPEIPEMGGIAIIAGLSAGLLLAISYNTLFALNFNLIFILAALSTILIIAIIGICDDLLDLPQYVKAVIPLFCAIPLVVVNAAESTVMNFPLIGPIDFGIIYIIALIPLAIAISSNLTNMLAGFNGMEVGMGAIIFGTMTILAFAHGNLDMLVISISMFASLLGFLIFNFYPAKVFPGDVGNLTIGAVLASTVIIGNFESAGAILVIPYVIDFFIKAKNRFPHTHQNIKDGKLFPKNGNIKGLVHLVMHFFKGITEKNLVLVFYGIETVFAIIVLALYL